jgi:hypothetical protein
MGTKNAFVFALSAFIIILCISELHVKFVRASDLPSDMPVVFVDPLNVTAAVGDTFTVSVRVFNLSENFYGTDETWTDGEPLPPPSGTPLYNYSLGYLYGFDIRINWNPTILEYVSHIVMVPVEEHADGILHEPTVGLMDAVDTDAGTYQLAQTSIPPAADFNAAGANATVFAMTFSVKKEGECGINFTNVDLAASATLSVEPEVPHWVINGRFQTEPLMSPSITLTPETGVATTTITGTGFHPNSTITIAWDGEPIPTVPHHLAADSDGNFTAIISVPTQTDPGTHNVTTTDDSGAASQAVFTVTDLTGPQGEPGTVTLPELPWVSLILSLFAVGLAAFVALRKR